MNTLDRQMYRLHYLQSIGAYDGAPVVAALVGVSYTTPWFLDASLVQKDGETMIFVAAVAEESEFTGDEMFASVRDDPNFIEHATISDVPILELRYRIPDALVDDVEHLTSKSFNRLSEAFYDCLYNVLPYESYKTLVERFTQAAGGSRA